jgi:hypothetical protein
MDLKRMLAAVAGAAFAVSFLLPAFGDLPGYTCFMVCWSAFTRSDASGMSLGAWLYYSGFVAANALFVVLEGSIFAGPRFQSTRLWASALALVQVISWLGVNLWSTSRGERFGLDSGYFLWLLAFIALFYAYQLGRVPAGRRNRELAGAANRQLP